VDIAGSSNAAAIGSGSYVTTATLRLCFLKGKLQVLYLVFVISRCCDAYPGVVQAQRRVVKQKLQPACCTDLNLQTVC